MKNKIFSVVTAIAVTSAFCVPAFSVSAETEITELDGNKFMTEDWVFERDSSVYNGVDLLEYHGDNTDVIIPETIGDFKIVSFCPDYLPENITSVYIHENVKDISFFDLANYPNLKTVTLKCNGARIFIIMEESFVEELTIPDLGSISIIRAKNSKNLKKITFIGDSAIRSIGKEWFTNCESLGEIIFSGKTRELYIEMDAFKNCALEKLEFPCYCEIEKYAFGNNTKLTDVTFNGKADIAGMSFKGCSSLKNVSFNKGGTANSFAFDECTNIENIDISDDLELNPKAFNNCLKLMTINSEPAFDSKTCDFSSKYKDFILKNFNGAQDIGFINEYVEANVKRIVSEVTNKDMTDIQKVEALHDWICSNTEYDHDNINADNNHNDASVLMSPKTVCEGYASFYDLLLNEAGIESYFVHSNDHAWNIINIDGHYFHSDTTWDDLTSSKKWFLKSDEEMKSEGGSHGSWKLLVPSSLHKYDRTTAPVCENIIGDVNADGEINTADLVEMSLFLHGKKNPEKNDAILYDTDFDGEINVFDMIQMRKKLITQ